MNDQERLIEIVRRRMEHLGLHSHLYNMDGAAMELVRSLRDGDGITLTPPPKPERTYRITERQRKQICRALSSARTNIHPRMDSDDAANIHDTWLLVAGLSPEEE